MFLMLHSINWPNFIIWLHLLLEILGNICIVIVCWEGCDVMKFEWALSFLSSRFATWWKSHDKNLNILRGKRAFQVTLKVFFTIFKGLSVAKNCLRPESAPLNMMIVVTETMRSLSRTFILEKPLLLFSFMALFAIHY